ncbi:MAG TPA: cytochrome c, partial [Gemmataceae bacterium]|nr:cytochrome c [Gemmataceae bacterium]
MRRTTARILVAAALFAGLVYLGQAGAADAPAEEFPVIVDQDAKILARGIAAVEKANEKAKKNVERNAANGAKSSAMYLATIANDSIAAQSTDLGKAKVAAIRDAAVRLYKAASEKDFKGIADAAKGLNPTEVGGAKKIDLSKAFPEATPKDVMHNFLKYDQYGMNGEADIIAQGGKKKVASLRPEQTVAIAHRVIAMHDLSKTISSAEGGAKKKEWDDFNDKMLKAGTDLLAAGRAKKTGPELSKAFQAVDASCKACHNVFK